MYRSRHGFSNASSTFDNGWRHCLKKADVSNCTVHPFSLEMQEEKSSSVCPDKLEISKTRVSMTTFSSFASKCFATLTYIEMYERGQSHLYGLFLRLICRLNSDPRCISKTLLLGEFDLVYTACRISFRVGLWWTRWTYDFKWYLGLSTTFYAGQPWLDIPRHPRYCRGWQESSNPRIHLHARGDSWNWRRTPWQGHVSTLWLTTVLSNSIVSLCSGQFVVAMHQCKILVSCASCIQEQSHLI